MKPKLPSTIYSHREMSELILEVRRYTQWYRQQIISARVGAKNTDEQPEITEVATTLIRDWAQQDTLTPDRLDQLIAALEDIARQAPTITITLVAPASSDVKKALVSWCRQTLHPEMLVTIRFNSTVVGGMVVRLGSHMYDWSWRRTLMDHKDRYPGVLDRV